MDEAQRNRGYDGDGEEEEYDDNYVPLEYGDAATGGAGEDQEEPDDVPNDAATGEAAEDQEEPDDVPDDAATGEVVEDQEEPDDVPDDDHRRVIVDARTQGESQKEKLKFDRMLEDHKKRVIPQLRRWQHKARYRTGIAAVEGRECCA